MLTMIHVCAQFKLNVIILSHLLMFNFEYNESAKPLSLSLSVYTHTHTYGERE